MLFLYQSDLLISGRLPVDEKATTRRQSPFPNAQPSEHGMQKRGSCNSTSTMVSVYALMQLIYKCTVVSSNCLDLKKILLSAR